eukprot:4174680-Pleurochrysis_carterae.AAC.1
MERTFNGDRTLALTIVAPLHLAGETATLLCQTACVCLLNVRHAPPAQANYAVARVPFHVSVAQAFWHPYRRNLHNYTAATVSYFGPPIRPVGLALYGRLNRRSVGSPEAVPLKSAPPTSGIVNI